MPEAEEAKAEVKEERAKVEKKKEPELPPPPPDYHVYDRRASSHSFCTRCRRHVRDPQSGRELPAYKQGVCPA